MATMIVHDTRLSGRTPLSYNFVMVVNQARSIDSIISVVATRARNVGSLNQLHIFCHGYEAAGNERGQMTMPRERGGFGLQLGAENLDLYNYGKARAWKGLIKRIVLFACAPADTAGYNEGRDGDGERFCGYLSLVTGAEVIGARDTQYYNKVEATYAGGRKVKDTIDFGAWEGPVYSFRDGVKSVVTPGNYSMGSPSV